LEDTHNGGGTHSELALLHFAASIAWPVFSSGGAADKYINQIMLD
jgi:hypothetical protein